MTISEVSRKYNITADTIRYYEKEGLIPAVPRDKNGIRDFDENSCGWIEFIKCMRSAGLEIETLKRYVSLFRQGTATGKERKIFLIEQREKLLKKQENIKATLDRLNYKIEKYEEIEKGKLKDFTEKP